MWIENRKKIESNVLFDMKIHECQSQLECTIRYLRNDGNVVYCLRSISIAQIILHKTIKLLNKQMKKKIIFVSPTGIGTDGFAATFQWYITFKPHDSCIIKNAFPGGKWTWCIFFLVLLLLSVYLNTRVKEMYTYLFRLVLLIFQITII